MNILIVDDELLKVIHSSNARSLDNLEKLYILHKAAPIGQGD